MAPVPLPTRNTCRTSWNWMENDIRLLVIPDTAFHRNSTRPITLKSVPPPLGIITTVFQAHDAASSPPLKPASMKATTFSQFTGSVYSYRISAQSHILRCSDYMPDGTPAQCSCSRRTTSAISSSPGILSSTGKGDTSIGIVRPGGGTWS